MKDGFGYSVLTDLKEVVDPVFERGEGEERKEYKREINTRSGRDVTQEYCDEMCNQGHGTEQTAGRGGYLSQGQSVMLGRAKERKKGVSAVQCNNALLSRLSHLIPISSHPILARHLPFLSHPLPSLPSPLPPPSPFHATIPFHPAYRPLSLPAQPPNRHVRQSPNNQTLPTTHPSSSNTHG